MLLCRGEERLVRHDRVAEDEQRHEVEEALVVDRAWQSLGDHEAEAYDPKTDRWTSLAKHPTGFHAAAAFANGPSVYIVGGNAGCGGDKPLATVQALRLP
jgi:hypothetical protein